MSFVPLKNLIPQITTRETPTTSNLTPHYTWTSSVSIGQKFFRLFKAAIQEICGEVVSAQIQSLYINNNTLVVICFTQAAQDVLGLKEREILVKVNEGLAGAAIKRLWCIG